MAEFNLFQTFNNKIMDFPLWVKEVVYFQLKQSIDQYFDASEVLRSPDSIFQFFRPKLTYAGKKEFESRGRELSSESYKFLEMCGTGHSIVEMTLANFWTLEEIAKMFTYCVSKELVTRPDDKKMEVTAAYMASEIRLGEYFKRIEVIDIEQLERALRAQKASEESGNRIGMGQILIDMGFITQDDISLLLQIKDESRKRFIFNFNMGANKKMEDPTGLEEIAQKLTAENIALKKQLEELRSGE